MGRGPKPAKSKVGAKRFISPKPPKSDGATISALEKRLAATGEILRLISSSPADVQPVFDAIARHAVALCGGVGGIVVRYDGTVMRLAAHHNVSAESRELHETSIRWLR
jgi:hypothetical protein